MSMLFFEGSLAVPHTLEAQQLETDDSEPQALPSSFVTTQAPLQAPCLP